MNVRVIGTPREVEQVTDVLRGHYEVSDDPTVYAARRDPGKVRVYLDLRPLGGRP
jgi:hypothetical protein